LSVAVYLDSSALVKLVVAEPESDALQRFLRGLDAIHLASAMELGDDLDCVVTYDRRMSDAAHVLGLVVRAPGTVGDVPRRRAKKLSAKKRT
jgi:predicted nucleic acid-binding protein